MRVSKTAPQHLPSHPSQLSEEHIPVSASQSVAMSCRFSSSDDEHTKEIKYGNRAHYFTFPPYSEVPGDYTGEAVDNSVTSTSLGMTQPGLEYVNLPIKKPEARPLTALFRQINGTVVLPPHCLF